MSFAFTRPRARLAVALAALALGAATVTTSATSAVAAGTTAPPVPVLGVNKNSNGVTLAGYDFLASPQLKDATGKPVVDAAGLPVPQWKGTLVDVMLRTPVISEPVHVRVYLPVGY